MGVWTLTRFVAVRAGERFLLRSLGMGRKRKSNRDCAGMSSDGEFQGCVAPESETDIGIFRCPSGPRLHRPVAKAVNGHLGNDET